MTKRKPLRSFFPRFFFGELDSGPMLSRHLRTRFTLNICIDQVVGETQDNFGDLFSNFEFVAKRLVALRANSKPCVRSFQDYD